MRYVLVLMIGGLGWLTTSQAQTLETTLSLRAEVGSQVGMASTSGTDLSFQLPLVGRLPDELNLDTPRPFAAFVPVGRLQYGGPSGSLSVFGAARYQAVAEHFDQVQYAHGHVEAAWRMSKTWQSGWAGVLQQTDPNQVGRLVWDAPTQVKVTEMAGLAPDHTRFWTGVFLEATLQERASIRVKVGYQRRTQHMGKGHNYAFTQIRFDWYQHDGFRIQSSAYTRFQRIAEARYYGAMLRVFYALRRMQTMFHLETEQGGFPLLQNTFGEAVEDDRILRAVRQDRFWRMGLTGIWDLGADVAVVAQLDLIQPARAFFSRNWHSLHVGTGVQWKVGRRTKATSRAPSLWQQEGPQALLHFPYPRRGDLYIVGDFNDWTQPGIPLMRQQGGHYTTTLTLPPGRYQYKILRVDEGRTEWLPLPPDALTEADSFGGVNGILIVDTLD